MDGNPIAICTRLSQFWHIVDMTVSRFNAFDRLARELDQARTELAERKLIERAKGILMKSRGIGEEVVATGARIVGAAMVVEEVVAGASTVAFA